MIKKGNRRKTGKEQYYTLPSVADVCVKKMLDFVGPNRTFLEPAGGEGSFIDALLRYGVQENNIISFDIEPKHRLVKFGNFLEIQDLPKGLVTITNPPFGRANSLSKKFFNHAAKFSDYIGFIVPKSWRKWSIHNALDLNFHLTDVDMDLPSICFYSASGEVHTNENLNCVFQIWERKEKPRSKIKIKDNGLIVKTTPQNADIALVIFGWGCGRVLREFERKPNTTLLFLKVKNSHIVDILEKADFEKFCDNVAYTKALSLEEINFLLNESLGLPQFEGTSQTDLF